MEKSFPYGICRICGADPPLNTFAVLLLPSFIDLVNNHLNIKILETDKCSQLVCSRCVKTVKNFGVLAEKAKSLQQTIEKYVLFQHEENEARQVKVEGESLVLSSDEEEICGSNNEVNPPANMTGLGHSSQLAASESADMNFAGWNDDEAYITTLSRPLPSMPISISRERLKCRMPGVPQETNVIDNEHKIVSLKSTPKSAPSDLLPINKRNKTTNFSTPANTISTNLQENFASIIKPDTFLVESHQIVIPNRVTEYNFRKKMTRYFKPSTSSTLTKETGSRSNLANIGVPITTPDAKKCLHNTEILNQGTTEAPEVTIAISNVEALAEDQQEQVPKMKTLNKRRRSSNLCPLKKRVKFHNQPCGICWNN